MCRNCERACTSQCDERSNLFSFSVYFKLLYPSTSLAVCRCTFLTMKYVFKYEDEITRPYSRCVLLMQWKCSWKVGHRDMRNFSELACLHFKSTFKRTPRYFSSKTWLRNSVKRFFSLLSVKVPTHRNNHTCKMTNIRKQEYVLWLLNFYGI